MIKNNIFLSAITPFELCVVYDGPDWRNLSIIHHLNIIYPLSVEFVWGGESFRCRSHPEFVSIISWWCFYMFKDYKIFPWTHLKWITKHPEIPKNRIQRLNPRNLTEINESFAEWWCDEEKLITTQWGQTNTRTMGNRSIAMNEYPENVHLQMIYLSINFSSSPLFIYSFVE